MIVSIYSGAAYKYRITKGSHTSASFPNIYKYSFRGFIRMYFKMAKVLFSVETNVLGFDGVALTDKPLLLPHNTCSNIKAFLFVCSSLGPCSMF